MYLNTKTIIDADTVVFTQKALEIVHQWLGAKKETK